MLWIKDKIKWHKLALPDKLELLRKHYCTGPCGQSQSVQTTRSVTHLALIEAINELVKYQSLKDMLNEINEND